MSQDGAGNRQEDDGGPSEQGDDQEDPIVVIASDPDQAWKALGLVNDWIKHAEVKSVATLAASGVSGGLIFNLVKDARDQGAIFNIVTVVGTIAVVLSASSAAAGLMPRLVSSKRRENPTSPLYFSDIARAYQDDGPSYVDVLQAITGSPEELTRHIAQQVHANAGVAHRKYRWANRGIVFLFVGLAAIGAIALILGIRGGW